MRPTLIAEDCACALAQTRALWDEVRGRRIFLTGGTGFFGSWFLELLTYAADELRFDCEVVVLTRDPGIFLRGAAGHLARHRCVRLLQGDVRNFAYPAGEFPLVVHFGSSGPRALLDEPEAFFDMVVGGTRRVLQFAEQAGARRLLLASTGSVYGQAGSGPFRETDLSGPDSTSPSSANAEAKRVVEFLAGCLVRRRPELAVGLARGFVFVGPYLPAGAGFAAYDFLRDASAGRSITIKGDGTPVRSYLYAADLAVWLWTILLRTPAGAARAWNIGSEEPVSVRQLAEMVAKVATPPPPVQVLGRPVAGQLPQIYLPDTTRARQELGLGQTIALPAALARSLAWMNATQGPAA